MGKKIGGKKEKEKILGTQGLGSRKNQVIKGLMVKNSPSKWPLGSLEHSTLFIHIFYFSYLV